MILVCETLIASIQTVENLGKKLFRKNLRQNPEEHQLRRVTRLLEVAKLVVGKPFPLKKSKQNEGVDSNEEIRGGEEEQKEAEDPANMRRDGTAVQLLKQNFAHTFFGPPRLPAPGQVPSQEPCDFQVNDLKAVGSKKKINHLYDLWKRVCVCITDPDQPLSNPQLASDIEKVFQGLIKDAEVSENEQDKNKNQHEDFYVKNSIVTKTLEQAMQNFRNRCVTYGCLFPKHPYKKQDVVMYCQRCKNYFKNLDMSHLFTGAKDPKAISKKNMNNGKTDKKKKNSGKKN